MTDHTEQPLVTVAVPAPDLAAVAATLAELFADLELPPRFSVIEGDARIEDYPLLPSEGASICDTVVEHRVQLLTEALAERAGMTTALLRELVRCGLRTSRASPARPEERDEREHRDDAVRLEDALDDAGGRFALRLGRETRDALTAPVEAGKGWSELVTMMADGLFYELGLTLGSCELIVDDRVPANAWRVEINDLRLPAVPGLSAGELLVNDTPHRMQLLGVAGRPAINPANGARCSIIGREATAVCEGAGLTTWSPAGYTILSLSAAIRRHAGALLPRLVVDHTLKNLARAFPDLVDAADHAFSLDDTTRVLRGLLREEVTIRNLRHILEAMVALGPPPDVDLARHTVFTLPGNDTIRPRGAARIPSIVEGVRSGLKRQISHMLTQGGSTLVVYLLDPEIERNLAEGEPTPALVAAVRRAMADQRESQAHFPRPPAVLTSSHARARCAALFEGDVPRRAVIAYTELSPDLNIQPIMRISLG
jgi:type III secretory pathway component EscV